MSSRPKNEYEGKSSQGNSKMVNLVVGSLLHSLKFFQLYYMTWLEKSLSQTHTHAYTHAPYALYTHAFSTLQGPKLQETQ